jgi:hypothetical protein
LSPCRPRVWPRCPGRRCTSASRGAADRTGATSVRSHRKSVAAHSSGWRRSHSMLVRAQAHRNKPHRRRGIPLCALAVLGRLSVTWWTHLVLSRWLQIAGIECLYPPRPPGYDLV